MTEKPFLKSFFETFGASIELVPWDKLKRNDIDVLLKLFDNLPPDKRDEAEIKRKGGFIHCSLYWRSQRRMLKFIL
ncbi:hypothetical protein FACS189443_3780 [Planctomycetales bacterium]|nr:hypothetical protein FACS189443_3780 [Planctomycetales bacterium]